MRWISVAVSHLGKSSGLDYKYFVNSSLQKVLFLSNSKPEEKKPREVASPFGNLMAQTQFTKMCRVAQLSGPYAQQRVMHYGIHVCLHCAVISCLFYKSHCTEELIRFRLFHF